MTTSSKKTRPTQTPSGNFVSSRDPKATTSLGEHPAYLQGLRSQLAENCRAFDERRSHATDTIGSTLLLLANDPKLDKAARRHLIWLFERLLERVKALEAAIPKTERTAIAILDQLDIKARSRRGDQT
jgi:hypothetical protein